MGKFDVEILLDKGQFVDILSERVETASEIIQLLLEGPAGVDLKPELHLDFCVLRLKVGVHLAYGHDLVPIRIDGSSDDQEAHAEAH